MGLLDRVKATFQDATISQDGYDELVADYWQQVNYSLTMNALARERLERLAPGAWAALEVHTERAVERGNGELDFPAHSVNEYVYEVGGGRM